MASPSKVVVRKDRNVVAENACWEEAIKKESRSQVLNEHFQINPKSRRSTLTLPAVVILTDKPMVHKPVRKDMSEELGGRPFPLLISRGNPWKTHVHLRGAQKEIPLPHDLESGSRLGLGRNQIQTHGLAHQALL